MSIATDFIALASMDIEDFGHVQQSTVQNADAQAIGGKKTPTGYIFEYEDGSRLDFNKFTFEMELLS